MAFENGREVPVSSGWLVSIMEEATIHNKSVVKSQSTLPKIQKVPSKLGQVDSNQKCYIPSVVSIGPFHHGKEELAAVERLKPQIASDFVIRCGMGESQISEKFAEVACLARNCYTEGSTDIFDDEAFAKMMFVDGCFILNFVYCNVIKDKRGSIKMRRADLAYAQRDLFLLENQIPFPVLQTLATIVKCDENEDWIDMIKEFVQQTRAIPPKDKRCSLLNTLIQVTTDLESGKMICNQTQDESGQFTHLLDLLHKQLIGNSTPCKKNPTSDWYSYRSVSELKLTGIKFRASETNRFTDVKFEPNFVSGNLSLPPMTIDDSTKSILLNLVAYEMCPDTPDDSAITSYICLMDSLIDKAEDVRELRSKGILLNFLGSDQHVADLFNEIGNDLVPNPLLYDDVKGKIERHYKNRCKIWITEWLHTHFRTPWAFLAFLAAVFVIALAVTQTYFAANPPKD